MHSHLQQYLSLNETHDRSLIYIYILKRGRSSVIIKKEREILVQLRITRDLKRTCPGKDKQKKENRKGRSEPKGSKGRTSSPTASGGQLSQGKPPHRQRG
jgi:hypothetical protein